MISIVDTGSTDDTKKIIYKWGKDNNIDTSVHDEEFKNFSYNRTHSIKKAKETYTDADFFLLSDADFIWEKDIGNKFDKILLVDHKYLIEQYNKAIRYWNIRLLSAKVDWECVGVTHEYWQECKSQSKYTGQVRLSKINTLVINDKEDGGCKTDKYERDKRLLQEGLDDPNTPANLKTRYKFYLAQTFKDVREYEKAIEFYTKRIDDGGWPEEVFYSKYQIGWCNEQIGWNIKKVATSIENKTKLDIEYLITWNKNNLGQTELMEEANNFFNSASDFYLKAYNYRPTRSESLYTMTKMYRLLGFNDLALKYSLIGNTIKYPTEDSLFIEGGCYDYLFDFEISIVAFYIKEKKDLGRQATSRLLTKDNLPKNLLSVVKANSKFYI
jgi:hypothetical protein